MKRFVGWVMLSGSLFTIRAPLGADEPLPVPTRQKGAESPTKERQTSWMMPEVVIYGEIPKPLKEEQRIGGYAQPRWTATRRFPTTRIFVRPEGYMQFEHWIRPTFDRATGFKKNRMQFEWEMGLPNRFQFDLYLKTVKQAASGALEFEGISWELRYALADWGVLPANPTLYLEYITRNNAVDKYEAKLLFGDELAPRWHWGVNGVFEYELGGAEGREIALTGGVSYAVTDMEFSIGVEAKIVFEDDNVSRGNFQKTSLAGPSLQWRPLPAFHVDVAALFGLDAASPLAEPLLVAGWEF